MQVWEKVFKQSGESGGSAVKNINRSFHYPVTSKKKKKKYMLRQILRISNKFKPIVTNGTTRLYLENYFYAFAKHVIKEIYDVFPRLLIRKLLCFHIKGPFDRVDFPWNFFHFPTFVVFDMQIFSGEFFPPF